MNFLLSRAARSKCFTLKDRAKEKCVLSAKWANRRGIMAGGGEVNLQYSKLETFFVFNLLIIIYYLP